ncbi:SDR family NAD(P)-dependent oxidoreductase [Shinella daejeonensis]|uniref:type I polyketide synthase n=1 Tax=Shinella daejeonensis TaxID=659017 RepID=UPI0020C80E04|nr:type I polyketide synthase [Shinella daejeonensis]MCP8895594.1 SDR family NAD(P)-dependent oxidoreductase [Shinella daejeonensis]
MTVEIIGYAAIAPGADSASQLFDVLCKGICTVTEVPAARWDRARFWHPNPGVAGKTYTFAAGVVGDIESFDARLFGLSRREAMAMDPQQRLLLSVTWRALEDANLPLADLRDETVGVYVGASSLDSANLSAEDPASGGPYFMTGNTLSIVANRISHIFGLSGPSLTIDTACSSSLVALDQAVRALNRGEIDTAIVGGVNLLSHPLPFVGFAQARMLSPEGRCRAYDDDASGYVRAEGAVTVVLRRSDRASAKGDRSRARIVASGVNSAGRTNGISLPSQEAQARLLEQIYSESALDPNHIAFIEGHGTGTKVGDPAEVWAIGHVIGAKRHAPVPLGSIKTNIGHTEPASGLFGLIKAVMALENDYLPASLFFEKPNETIDFAGLNVRVTSTALELLRGQRPRLAGVNSFGFGGTNVHVVISDPVSRPPAPAAVAGDYFMVSAHTHTALTRLLEDYRDVLSASEAAEADALTAAATAGRTPLRHRFVCDGRSSRGVTTAIDRFLAIGNRSQGASGEAPAGDPKVAFVFAGNGAQWAGMGVEAFRGNASFRRHFTAVSALFEAHIGERLSDLLVDPALAGRLTDTRVAQPLLFSIQVALAQCLIGAGIRPAAVLGHSIGEVAAAHIAGALSLVDAVAVVAVRSRCQHATQGKGTMAAALCSAEAAHAFLEKNGFDDLTVGAVNASNSVTISGPRASIEAVRSLARRQKIAVQLLDIDYPFHHPLVDEAKDEFLSTLPTLSPREAEYDFISTVTGDALVGTALDASYWWRNVREPVHFMQGMAKALEAGCNLLIELSPRAILTNYLKDAVKVAGASAQTISTLDRDEEKEGQDPVARCIMRALAHGAALPRAARNAAIDLPAVPYERESMAGAPTSDSYDIFGRDAAAYTLAGWRADPNGFAWKNHVDARLFCDLAEHVVDGRSIMPGAGFIEIALQAARQSLGTDHVQLTNIELLRPLELDANMVELSSILSRETGMIEIRSRERLSADDWTVHAVCRCQKVMPGVRAGGFAALPETGVQEVPKEQIYRIASSFGLDYGPAFRLARRALTDGGRRIDVELERPLSPAHPMLAWGLNPMVLDAAFHGLVGLFDKFSGDEEGAPYIPVHFGSVCVLGGAGAVARARIDVERVSPHSIKARFLLETADGTPVLLLEDCRFRRTWLRQHQSLSSLAYHYEARPAPGVLGACDATEGFFLETREDCPLEDATLLINAAVFRATYDIAAAVVDGNGRIGVGALPGDRAFRAFLANVFHILEDAGLARQEAGVWTIEPNPDLPAVGEVLSEFLADRPNRGAEAVMLADIRAGALRHIEELARNEAGDAPELPGKATGQAFLLHAPQARERGEIVLEAAAKVIAARGRALSVTQIGVSSAGFSQRLADMVARAGGRLDIVEPADDLRRAAEVPFEQSARVDVGKCPRPLVHADLIISVGDRLNAVLSSDEALAAAFAEGLANGAHLIAVETAPSRIYDFFFGLSADWFSSGIGGEFYVGRLASETDWSARLSSVAGKRHSIRTISAIHGPLLLIEATGSDAGGAAKAVEAPPFVQIGDNPALAGGGARISLHGTEAECAAALDAAQDGPATAAYVYALPAPAADTAATLAREANALACFAGVLQGRGNGKSKPVLMLLLPGGAPAVAPPGDPAADPLASGLWTFARVLANEFSGVDVRLVDAAPEDWPAALRLLAASQAEREWRVMPGGHAAEALRVAGGPIDPVTGSTDDFSAATVRQRTQSRVDSLYWEATDVPLPGAEDVVVEVAAAGLNFRDVMWAMGLLPEEALEDGFAGATIGMEFSGRVTAVGKGVADLAVGDAVMGIGPAAFSTHAVVRRAGIAKIPGDLDVVAAATVPVTFLTAWYAIVELGRARRGETILVHGAAGGVGLAAIQIAAALGLKVFATAGSAEKRRYLRALGVEHVFDSRSLSFVADVREATDGAGVDLVLNSLFSDAMERSIELVKPFGRFLELGKRDYYADRKIGLRPFRRNVSYFGIDADQLPLHAPELTRSIFEALGERFAAGELRALPYRAFDHGEIADAFRLMQNAGHIGKIVLLPPKPGRDAVERAPGRALSFPATGVHVVVGGIGGFGLAAAEWIVARGARRIALVTRRGVADEETLAAVKRWNEAGVASSLHACDITDARALDGLLSALRREGPIAGVLHAAMVLDDALLPNLTEERFRAVIDVKARGADALDKATRGDKLDYFILFSSATTMVGNPGQGNYVAANGYLEGLARRRRAEGLPALAVAFGAISDKGYLSRNDEVNELLARRIGNTAMKAATALAMVEAHMRADPGTVEAGVFVCSPIDWAAARNLAVVGTPLFEVLLRQAGSAGSGGSGETIDLLALVADKGEAGALSALYQLVASEMAAILRVPVDTLSRDKILKDVGLDSLMAVELGLGFKEKTGFDIPLTSVGETTTIEHVVRKLYEKVARSSGEDQDEDDVGDVEALAEQHMGSTSRSSGAR